MVSQARRFSLKSMVQLAALALALMLPAATAYAQERAIYAPGEPIITGFAGVLPPATPPASGDPIDQTFINPDGSSMVIQQLQPNGPPQGQMIPSPTVFSAKARDVGQVFGIALDDAQVPNIYLTATSAFGLNLVVPDASGNPERSKLGAPGAQFMAGQWGTAGGAQGTPGGIYKVDGTTGEISLFTTIAANSGAGLGDIVFDRATEQFFVSDLDTGLIYRLGLDGTILDTFDHGVAGRPNRGLSVVPDDGSEIDITNPAFNTEDPKTWGFAPPERKVYGLAMHGGRLFYAVAAGPQIWSIGINLDGTFSDDARWELDVTGLPSSNEVSNIVFDNQGRMILAQRGPQVGSYDYSVFAEPQTSSVVRYAREVPDDINTPSVWVETPDSYAIGFRPDGQNATGGIALGYAYDAKNRDFGGACGAFLWSTGDSLRDNPALATRLAAGGPAVVHGLQGNDRDLVRPQNDPPNASYFTDYDGQYDDGANQGHVGDVEIWQQCDGGYIPPYMPPPGYVPPPSFNLTLTKAATPRTCFAGDGDWFCGFTIRVKNTGSTVYWGPVNVDDWLPDDNPGATMTFAPQPYWSCGQIGTTEYDCGYPPVALFPGDSLDLYETVKLPMRGNNLCWLDNGASIDWPYGLGDDNPGDDYDFASARIPDSKCRPPQGPKTNLQLQKFAHPANCLQGRGGWDCVFYVKVTNTGPGDYNAPTEVKDTLGINVPAAVSPSPPWSCAQAGATLTCDHPAQLLHPGQYVQFRVDAVIPYALARDKQICKLANSAQITKAPGGSDLNLDPSDDQAAATATIPGEQCNPDRPRTDLSIKKEAIGCSPSGDIGPAILPITGFACAFKVTVKNEGPANFNAPILVHDTFAPAIPPAQAVFAPSGLCSPSGGGYDCALPATNLLPGQTTSFFVGFRLPANTKVCDVKNSVKIMGPAGGTPFNFNPANDTGGAAVHIPSPGCSPGGPICTLRSLKPDGSCCPDGQVWNGRACSGQGPSCKLPLVGTYPDCHVPEKPTCRLPQIGTYPNCYVPEKPVCKPPQVGTYPNCYVPEKPVCKPPQVGTYPRCYTPEKPVCKPPQVGTYPNCYIPEKPVCRLPQVGVYPNCYIPEKPVCPPGTRGTPPRCVDIPIEVCPRGSTGTFPDCVKIEPRLCPSDSHGTWPRCVCNDNTHGTPGNCVPNVVRQCPSDSRGVYPKCFCPRGTHGDPGHCIPDGNDPGNDGGPVIRNPGIVLKPGILVTPECPPGTAGTPPRCLPLKALPGLKLNLQDPGPANEVIR
jgi:hypothetical protein